MRGLQRVRTLVDELYNTGDNESLDLEDYATYSLGQSLLLKDAVAELRRHTREELRRALERAQSAYLPYAQAQVANGAEVRDFVDFVLDELEKGELIEADSAEEVPPVVGDHGA